MSRSEHARKGKKSSTHWLRIVLRRSPIGSSPRHKATLRALGLHRRLQAVQLADNPQVRGMVQAVSHLVEVEPVSGDGVQEKME